MLSARDTKTGTMQPSPREVTASLGVAGTAWFEPQQAALAGEAVTSGTFSNQWCHEAWAQKGELRFHRLTVRYYFTPTRAVIIINTHTYTHTTQKIISVGEHVEKLEFLGIAGGNVK